MLLKQFLWQEGYFHVETMPYLILLKEDPNERGNYKWSMYTGIREQSCTSKERQLLLLPGAKVFLKLPTELSFDSAPIIPATLFSFEIFFTVLYQ